MAPIERFSGGDELRFSDPSRPTREFGAGEWKLALLVVTVLALANLLAIVWGLASEPAPSVKRGLY